MSQGLYVPNLKALGAPKKKCQLHTDGRTPSQPASQPHLEFKVKVSKLKPSQKEPIGTPHSDHLTP